MLEVFLGVCDVTRPQAEVIMLQAKLWMRLSGFGGYCLLYLSVHVGNLNEV